MSSALLEPQSDTAHILRIRRLSVAGVLDEGLRIVHEHYRELIRTALLVTLLPMIAAMYYGVAAVEELGFAFMALLERQQIDIWPYVRRVLAVTVPLFVAAYRIAEPLCLGALVVLAAGVFSGRRVTARDALRQSAGRGIALVVMWSLRWLAVQFGTIFCYLPGIVVAALFCSALPALVLEGIGPLRALGRSVELNGRRFWEAVLLVVLLGLIDISILECAQVMPPGLPRAAAMAVLYSSTLVLYAATITAFYFSGRCQLENYDLQVWAQSVAQRDAQSVADDSLSPELYPRV